MSTIFNRMRWFVIDDDLDDQEIFMLAVEKVDPAIQCTFANDGVDAINMLTKDPAFNPGRIFLDLNMPRMNGVECLKALQRIDRLKNVPIFMCSTSADPKIMAKARELGATDFIVKPSTISEFATLLADVHKNL